MTPERWEQIGNLYEAASALSAAPRAAFLAQACAGDAELRREIEAMLAAEQSVGDFIAAPAMRDAAQLVSAQPQGLRIGQRLGHYELLAFVGAGGMGEVYAAQDTRLGRKVAVKVLPAALARDDERLRRFEQEARAVGMLNHPNILTLHDVGTHETVPYLVSELLAGETLRTWLKRGPLPPRKAVEFALQIARGLAAAHERGLVHRDLKPENIFITTDERVKILDFGLAKLVPPRFKAAAETSAASAATNDTLRKLAAEEVQTNPGMVLGTVGYMAPEQVRGGEADQRADIFAFGVILYELFAGERPFRGATAVETMNAILNHEPPELPALQRAQAPGLERIIHRCLEKRPEQRFQSVSDLGFALEALTTSGLPSAEAVTLRQEAASVGWWRRFTAVQWVWFCVACAALAFGAGYFTSSFKRATPPAETLRLSLAPPDKVTRMSDPVLAPDGRRLVFSAATEGNRSSLWLRPLSSLGAQPLAGTEGASAPFWSPDGQSLGFFAQGKLKRLALNGESPVTLADAPSPRGGAWNRDGVILFVPHPSAGIQRITAAGGAAATLTTPDAARQESNHQWPSFLPDGGHYLYLVTGQQASETGIYVAALDGSARRRLLSATSPALYAKGARGGALLFMRDGALYAQAFDAAARQLRGEPERLAEQLAGGAFGRGGFSVSANGVLAYATGNPANNRQQPAWFDRTGKQLGELGSVNRYLGASLAPDETRLVTARPDPAAGAADLWVLDLARGTELRFTFDPANDMFPLWSPDSSRLAWVSTRDGASSLYQKAANGAGQDELLFRSGQQKFPTDWAADGRLILFQDSAPQTKWDVWALPLEGTHKPYALLQSAFNETGGRLSPDERWLTWVSDESGSNEVYVQGFAANALTGGKWQVSIKGGDQPRWRNDGKELFYVAADGKLMAVAVQSQGAAFKPGAPNELFDLRALKTAGRGYEVSSDGRKFLLVTNLEDAATAPFTIVLNWLE
ncbi:MAG: serine/threonine-protein kinase [Acidobacteria bacterium]|nr:serine/threonine-protein kinase [Acidobacteriota bacterium]